MEKIDEEIVKELKKHIAKSKEDKPVAIDLTVETRTSDLVDFAQKSASGMYIEAEGLVFKLKPMPELWMQHSPVGLVTVRTIAEYVYTRVPYWGNK